MVPIHIHKRAIRALGVSESFVKGLSRKSVLAGVVMRADMLIDGFTFALAEVGGMDATDRIIDMFYSLKRDDINILLLNGCVISWYNVIDLHRVFDETSIPLICVTYEESLGLEKYFRELFPDDWEVRVSIYHKNGDRTQIKIRTGHKVYVRFLGIGKDEARGVLNKFTIQGAIPEPLRVARLLARSIMKQLNPN